MIYFYLKCTFYIMYQINIFPQMQGEATDTEMYGAWVGAVNFQHVKNQQLSYALIEVR